VEEAQAIPGNDLYWQMIFSEEATNTRTKFSEGMSKRAARAFFSAFLISLAAVVFAQKPVPELWGVRVHDEAHVLKQETIDQLERQLKAYQDSTSNQIAILTITSLEGEVLEEYSLKVAEAWKLGSEKNDNGVLLLVAVDDHKMRIEAGQGLEGVLTDAQSNRIIRNEMAPEFRRGDYDQGVINGIDGIIKAIGGEYGTGDGESEDFEGSTWQERLLVSLFIFGILGIFTAVALFSKGFMAWVLYLFLMLFYFAFSGVVAGEKVGRLIFFFYVIGFPILKIYLNRHPKWKHKMMKWSGGGGGWGGGSSGGWSSGGGGFSGGGGSFGGGGSSGSW
jgi:uncharacterized protein